MRGASACYRPHCETLCGAPITAGYPGQPRMAAFPESLGPRLARLHAEALWRRRVQIQEEEVRNRDETDNWLIVGGLCRMQFGFAISTSAQSAPHGASGHVVTPQSSTYAASDAGVRAHTNVKVFVSDAGRLSPAELPPYAGYAFETPASLACIYGLAPLTPGSIPSSPSPIPMAEQTDPHH